MPFARRPWLTLALGAAFGMLVALWGWLPMSHVSLALSPAWDRHSALGISVPTADALMASFPHKVTPHAGRIQEQGQTATEAALTVIAAYNQASIAAAQTGDVTVLAPYLAPDGTAWTQTQAEYERRASRGEFVTAALIRWGVLDAAVDGATAMITTQEQWDVITTIGGTVISSRRGVVTRNVYTLTLDEAGDWRIVDVATTTLVA